MELLGVGYPGSSGWSRPSCLSSFVQHNEALHVTTNNHRAALNRQTRRAFTLGLPGVVLGASGTAGALWMGLDYTGITLLAFGVLLIVLGLFLVGVGFYCLAVLAEGWLRDRRDGTRQAGPVASASPPPPPPPTGGPHIF